MAPPIDLSSEFLNPRGDAAGLDVFTVRTAIRRALDRALPSLQGSLVDIGCGYMPYRSLLVPPSGRVTRYVGLDLANNEYAKPDVEWDGQRMPFPDSEFDSALATEVFEHCPDPEAIMREIARVLKPRGVLFLTVPFLWPLHCVPHDEYRYTPFSLERHLRNSGFDEIRLDSLGGWDASLAQMLGLWVRRRPMRPSLRRWLSRVAVPVVRFLQSRDPGSVPFASSPMITGLSGIAVRSA